jgi:circadian clock protein KaiC
LHFGFFETPHRLYAKARSLGIALPSSGSPELTLHWTSLSDNILDKLGDQLLGQVQKLGSSACLSTASAVSSAPRITALA